MSSTITLDDMLVETRDDWSKCRSPARSKRRHRRGFKTNRQVIVVPMKRVIETVSGFIMHPETYRQLNEALARGLNRKVEGAALAALNGNYR